MTTWSDAGDESEIGFEEVGEELAMEFCGFMGEVVREEAAGPVDGVKRRDGSAFVGRGHMGAAPGCWKGRGERGARVVLTGERGGCDSGEEEACATGWGWGASGWVCGDGRGAGGRA